MASPPQTLTVATETVAGTRRCSHETRTGRIEKRASFCAGTGQSETGPPALGRVRVDVLGARPFRRTPHGRRHGHGSLAHRTWHSRQHLRDARYGTHDLSVSP